MSRRLHREEQVEGKISARANDSDTAPITTANGRRVIGWIDTQGNFTTAVYGRSSYVARIYLLSDPYKFRLSLKTRHANVKCLRYGRAYGMRGCLP